MEWEIISAIVSVILLIVSIYFGGKYRKAKKKLQILVGLISEINDAIADDRVTKEEVGEIARKALELIADP